MTESLSTDQWMQLYQQTIDNFSDFSDATTVTATSFTGGGGGGGGGGDHLSPKACISKPIRRRSRASKRTATTLLNADAKNFRALVQQFTGCRRRSTSISFADPSRGPVNINFALGAENDYRGTHHAVHANSISQPSFVVNNSYSGQPQHLQLQDEQQQQNYHHQQLLSSSPEEEESKFYNYDSITTDDYLLTSCSPVRSAGSEIPQGFLIDDIFFLA